MSLRKSPQLTPALLAAARQNAQHSTGPRSPAPKQNSRLNALKHGAYVADENHRQAILALGEDPERLQTLSEELMSAFGPGDALWQGGMWEVGNEKQGLGAGRRRPACRRRLPASLAQFVLQLKKAYQPWKGILFFDGAKLECL